mgnify:CR=1 FL=1
MSEIDLKDKILKFLESDEEQLSFVEFIIYREDNSNEINPLVIYDDSTSLPIKKVAAMKISNFFIEDITFKFKNFIQI